LPFALTIGLAAGLATTAWALPAPEGARAPLVLVQAPGGESPRVAVAGERLSVRAAPRGNSPIVNHVEKNDEVIVVDSQAPWAKIEDYQSGRVLGWVYQSLLLAPGG
jgi:uncharacterized protein YgiM (DUF1202 family)